MSDKQTMLELINEAFPEEVFMLAVGFDDAIIGVETSTMRVVYSEKKCIEILCFEGMEYEDAIEHFDYNTKGSWIGTKTPIWVHDYQQ